MKLNRWHELQLVNQDHGLHYVIINSSCFSLFILVIHSDKGLFTHPQTHTHTVMDYDIVSSNSSSVIAFIFGLIP